MLESDGKNEFDAPFCCFSRVGGSGVWGQASASRFGYKRVGAEC